MGFYRKFVPFFEDINTLFSQDIMKGVATSVTGHLRHSRMSFLKTLQYPNPNKPYKLFTDSSKCSDSGILHQEKEGQPHTLIPIAYFSGSFGRTQQLWNTTQKECLAVYKSIQRF